MAITLTLDVAPHSQDAHCPDAVEPAVGTLPRTSRAGCSGLPGLVEHDTDADHDRRATAVC